jgi:hypothetical protein
MVSIYIPVFAQILCYFGVLSIFVRKDVAAKILKIVNPISFKTMLHKSTSAPFKAIGFCSLFKFEACNLTSCQSIDTAGLGVLAKGSKLTCPAGIHGGRGLRTVE